MKIPKGWTVLRHGSDMSRWDSNSLDNDKIIVKSMNGIGGLSCVEYKDAMESMRNGRYDTSSSYSKHGDGEAVELRILFYVDTARHADVENVKIRLNDDLKKLSFKYYWNNFSGGRHPVVPPKTVLLKLGESEFDEISNKAKRVLWYVPEELVENYYADLKKYGSKPF